MAYFSGCSHFRMKLQISTPRCCTLLTISHFPAELRYQANMWLLHQRKSDQSCGGEREEEEVVMVCDLGRLWIATTVCSAWRVDPVFGNSPIMAEHQLTWSHTHNVHKAMCNDDLRVFGRGKQCWIVPCESDWETGACISQLCCTMRCRGKN